MSNIPDPNTVMPNEYGTTVFLKNIVRAENIIVGDYTYYDDSHDPMGWEKNNVLFNYPFFTERLVIGRYCSLAEGSTFIMGAANHRLSSVTTYPFNVMGGVWRENSTPHIEELPHKGDTVIGNDVWIGVDSIIRRGVKIGNGAVVGANSFVNKDVPDFAIVAGNPAKIIRYRFEPEVQKKIIASDWWNKDLDEAKLIFQKLIQKIGKK